MISALSWIASYLALITAPLWLMLLGGASSGRGFMFDLSVALGFAGTVMIGTQFVLTARFRRATAPYGIDIIYYFHRYAALAAFFLILAHPVLLLRDQPAYLELMDPRSAPWPMLAGIGSIAALALCLATSIWRKPMRIHYDAWRRAHVLLALGAVALAIVHIHGFAYYSAAPPLNVAWPVMAASWGAVAVYVRIVRPWLVSRSPYRVCEIRRERGDAWTLMLEPLGALGLKFEPGQFAWLSLRGRPHTMKDHPFSIASSPIRPRCVEFTIKELGDFSRTIKDVKPEEVAYVDGPYGAFTIDRYHAAEHVFIAGGIGIVPIMSMLRAMADRHDKRRALLIYAYRRWERMTFREEIDTLAARIDLRIVHVLEEPPPDWQGECGRVTTALLARHLPAQRAGVECFVCGPEAMIQSVEGSLHELGVRMAHTHSELFDLV